MTETAVEFAARKEHAYRQALTTQLNRHLQPIYEDIERERIGVWDMTIPGRCPLCQLYINEPPDHHLVRHQASFISPDSQRKAAP